MLRIFSVFCVILCALFVFTLFLVLTVCVSHLFFLEVSDLDVQRPSNILYEKRVRTKHFLVLLYIPCRIVCSTILNSFQVSVFCDCLFPSCILCA